MRNLLMKIERLYFNGDTLRGPRSAFLFKELQKTRLSAKEGQVRQHMGGEGQWQSHHGLLSSHMDVDPRIFKNDLNRGSSASVISGVLDNAVGCCINVLLAQAGPKRGRAIYIFTASEEISRGDWRTFARSAKKVVRELARRKIKPDRCVAIDVTYPELKTAHHRMDWGKQYHELFHVTDKTHCYFDGYCTPASRRLVTKLARKIHNPLVRVRNFPGHDEASVYCRLCPSFPHSGQWFSAHLTSRGSRCPFHTQKPRLLR